MAAELDGTSVSQVALLRQKLLSESSSFGRLQSILAAEDWRIQQDPTGSNKIRSVRKMQSQCWDFQEMTAAKAGSVLFLVHVSTCFKHELINELEMKRKSIKETTE